MAARFAVQSFWVHNNTTGNDEFIFAGASRDSVTSQAFLNSPASFWSTTPVTVPTISASLAAYIAAYPNT